MENSTSQYKITNLNVRNINFVKPLSDKSTQKSDEVFMNFRHQYQKLIRDKNVS